MSRKGTQNKVYSPEFKLTAVRLIREERLTYHDAVRRLGLGDPEVGGNRHMLKRWERIYLEEGAEGLMKERRGRATKASNARIGRPPKLDKAVEEDLIAENQRLRMENEYLKKFNALALSRIKSENETKPE